ncbi:siderophore iron transporter mirC [Neurospora tetrasperma FGSC 2508]|uniref:Siderophore iron transporter mirC n=1 Tax=Neurospora tetrasperma (strain FGSC 2508 / ATCC MYA-4615 / P0657) TaxID=510951 RepID=F8MKP3_NEUT8|nr:siderophore iron transporter mirC [Neurospora tetrasperma FGSC 2508]EGO58271.1 siderophore iron transporter mirC [Neurospora tetrasperma FGSC 2508]
MRPDDDEIGSPLLHGHFSTEHLEVGSDGGDYGTAITPLYESDCVTPESDIQEGVRQIEAVSRAWTKSALIVAYMSIFLIAFTTSLEGQVTYALTAFAVSSFNNHSLLSTVSVVQNVVNAVIKPPMAKIADVFGRLEAFAISIVLCVLGYILMAASKNVETYASAQIFYAAGSTGLQILQQVFIADTSSFLNRALFSSLPDSPFLVTVWIGPLIASAILASTTWRWGYGMWALILPVAFLPLALSLYLNRRKAEALGILKPKHYRSNNNHGTTKTKIRHILLRDLDIIGTLLFSAGLSLILIPLTLISRSPQGWRDPKLLPMIILGTFLLILFPLWESRPNLAPHPLLPLDLLKSRTFVAGCSLGFFYFMIFYIAVQPYFYSYLLVALNLPVNRAGQITQTFSFASTIAAILASLGIRQSRSPRPRPFIITGALLYTFAIVILLMTRTKGVSIHSLFSAQAVLGAGAGLMHVATQLAVQASCGDKHAHVGVATAAFLTLVEVGAAVGAAFSGVIWGRLIPRKLVAYLPDALKGEAKKIYASVVVARSYPWGSVEREAIARAYQETVTVLLKFALVWCVPLVVVALFVGDYRLGEGGKWEVWNGRGLVVGTGEEAIDERARRMEERVEWWRFWVWMGKGRGYYKRMRPGRRL